MLSTFCIFLISFHTFNTEELPVICQEKNTTDIIQRDYYIRGRTGDNGGWNPSEQWTLNYCVYEERC